jgi:hypothetical protein
LETKYDQPTRNDSKTRVVARANKCFSSGDYSTAQVLLRGAAAEFPDDPEIADLAKRAYEGSKRKAEADRLITESQEQFAQQKFAEAIQSLRAAYELDKNNALARSILANALIEQAQSVAESDWWEAETLANEALRLNPAHPTAKSVHGLIFDRKMAGAVEEWVSQTRKLQSSGKLTAALSQIAEALVVYPHDASLLQIQDSVQREYGAQFRQARRRDLEDLRRMTAEIDAATDDATKKTLADRIHAVTARHSTDGEILTVANGLLRRMESPERSKENSTARQGPTSIDDPDAAIASEPLISAGEQVSQKQESAASKALAKPPSSRKVARNENSANVSRLDVSAARESVSSESALNAVLTVNAPSAKTEVQLPPPQTAAVSAAEGSASPEVRTQNAQPTLQITTPTEQPALSSSTKLILLAAAAIVVVAAISYIAGTHHARPMDERSAEVPTATAAAVAAPTVAPSAPSPEPTTTNTSLTTAHSSLNTTAGNTNAGDATAGRTIAGNSTQSIQDAPRQLPTRKEDGVGHVVNAQPKMPEVQTPRPQTLPSSLQPQPSLASLTIRGGAPGATVLVDQILVGMVQADGTLSVFSVNPGDHIVEMRKERFKPLQLRKHFDAGGAVVLSAADTTMEATPGQLKINFTPADAAVAIVKGDLLTTVTSGTPVNLAAGTYTLTARTADRFTRSSTLEVVAGQSRTVDLSLAPNGMTKWSDPGGWKQEGNSYTRKGGDFVLYGDAPTAGTFIFSVAAPKGRLQWVVNYSDPKNYVLFQMDENNLYRSVIRNGAKTNEIIVPDKSDKKSFRDLRIRVSATEIVHQIRHGDSWSVLDRWAQPGANLSSGKFGFYLPGNDQVSLSGFTHYADLNIR